MEWFRTSAQNGDIVSRGYGTPDGSGGYLGESVIYGTYDHSGLFNRKYFEERNSRESSICVFASYPENRAYKFGTVTERFDYGSYEQLGNFLGGHHIAVNRSLNNKGDSAMTVAHNHFYGNDGKKSDYDKWCQGKYYYDPLYKDYNELSEKFQFTNASQTQPWTTNYCSFIAWYGYRFSDVKSDLNSDYNSTHVGHMIVPDDIVSSCVDLYEQVWISDPPRGCNFFFGVGSGHYESRLAWTQSSKMVYKREK